MRECDGVSFATRTDAAVILQPDAERTQANAAPATSAADAYEDAQRCYLPPPVPLPAAARHDARVKQRPFCEDAAIHRRPTPLPAISFTREYPSPPVFDARYAIR